MKLLKPKRFGPMLAVLLIALSAVAIPHAFAQDATLEFVGVVEAQTATSLTVNGVVFDISRAEVETGVAVGATVEVEARLVNGAFVASEVDLARAGGRSGEIELTGVVEAFDGATITVAGRTLNLAGAEVGPNIAVGQVVEVHLVPAGDNAWTVREVDLDDDDDDYRAGRYEFVGTLDEVGLGYLVVSGQRIEVTNARLDGFLVLGTPVEVDFTLQNGVWSASKIDSRIDDDFDDDDSSGRRAGIGLTPVAPGCVASAPAGWTSYTIQSGDTLSALALRTGASLEQIINANCITNPGRVAIGTVLAVPRTPDPNIILRGDDDDDDRSGNRGSDNRNDDSSGRNDNSSGRDDDDRSGNSSRNRGSDDSSGKRGGDDSSGRDDDSSGSD